MTASSTAWVPPSFGKSVLFDIDIGRKASSAGGALFLGTIDEVRIYERALSPNDIAALYLVQ